MIWAKVSFQVLFLLTVWSFSIFGCKEYNQSDFGINHWVMSMCKVFSCVFGRGCLLWPVHSLGKTLLALSLLRFVLKAKFAYYSTWLPTFAFQSPIMKRTFFFWMLVLEDFVCLHRTIQLQLLQCYCLGHRLGEWFALETNRDHSVIFEIASRYCISDSFVDHDSYSISSEGFLPTVVHVMVIWVKFTHSSPF